MFGSVCEQDEEPGECCLFLNNHKLVGKPSLVAIFSGKTAKSVEAAGESEAVGKAMKRLRKVCWE